jgi:replicative superfamily II helicase
MALAQDGGFQSEVAQVRAKALLTEVTGQAPSYKWTYVAPRLVRNTTAALFDLETISFSQPTLVAGLQSAARQFAQTWESLAKLGERTSRQTALINAAAAYELAGYQANAACIARQLVPNLAQIERPTMTELASVFLQRLFLRLLRFAEIARQEPPGEPELDEGLWEMASVALGAEGLAAASRYFLSGREPALADALRLLERSEQGFTSLGLVGESNLVHTIRSLLPVMRERSTWAVLGDLVPSSARWQRYLKLLARGPGADVFRSASVSELWPSQLGALQQGLLSSSVSKVVRMPTSAGKTRVAELAMVHTLSTEPEAKGVYVAPYRALVGEIEQAFLNIFADLGFRVSSIIGTFESDDFEQLLASDADLLVVTPEKLDLLQRLQPDFLDRVRLIILDECQMVHDLTRGVKFELLLTRLKRRLPNARFILLSAVVPQQTLEDFARWFNAQPDDVMTSDWRPSIQRVAKLEWQGNVGTLRYSPSEDIQLLREFVPGLIKQQTFEFVNPRTGRVNRRRFPEADQKAQIAAELAFKFAESGPVLVFCSQRNWVEAVGKAIQSRLNWLELQGEPVPPYFRTGETRAAMVSREWLGEDHLTSQLLSSGVAVHYGDLPEGVRKAVESDFRGRHHRILVATNTLAQGVNLPIRTAIIHSCWRHSEDGTAARISARDYWNIAGRAGRAGEETEGTIIHIVRNDQDEQDYQYFLDHRENVEPVESALFQLLKELVQERLTETALADRLDPEVLAILVEEGAASLTDELVESVLADSLVYTQASRERVSLDRLRAVFRQTGNSIVKEVPEAEYRTVYSGTGLNTQSCETIRRHVEENREELRNLLLAAGPSEASRLASLFLDACSEVREMQPERGFAGSYAELLGAWLSGADISDLRDEFAAYAPTVDELAKFIEDFFGYRLPWGISAYIRIAAKVLGLPLATLSPVTRFFPSMVKLGVPSPEAAWAMAAGIPFRRLGIELSSRYLSERPSSGYHDFLEWLGSLDIEALHEEYDVPSPILEDVARALARSGANPYLAPFSGLDRHLPLDAEVKGVGYQGRWRVASLARPGERVVLERDYDNPVDRNAVLLELNSRTLGYLPRQLAQLVAPEMDAGLNLEAVVVSVDLKPGRTPRITLRLTAERSNGLVP